jgi:uncharacterized membrane protein
MDILKKIFPLSWAYTKDVANLIIGILIYIVGGAIAGAVIGFLSAIPVIGLVFGLVGSLIGIYSLAGIVLQILVFTKVLKD